MYYIGIDLGTSAVKIVLTDVNGNMLNAVTKEYPVSYPADGWSEQEPADWWEGVVCGVRELLKSYDSKMIKGIGVAGQMHGLVVLDKDDNVIRPAILWNDGRSSAQTIYLNKNVGCNVLAEETANIAFAGFTAPKLLWLRENEPDNFSKVRKIMLPKDYIVYRLTGEFVTDYSDASGMLLLDVRNRKWSDKMCEICHIDRSLLPGLHESYEIVGTLKKTACDELGLLPTVKVAAGAGDNAAAAVGTGVVGNGGCNISLGTSGTIFISSDSFRMDGNNALHSFCHADGGYHLMGCILSAASCNKWWMEEILHTGDYAGEQARINKLGTGNEFFLPYLMGERSPHNDPNARGTFIGLNMNTSREDMTRAVMEGVAFALRDSLEIARSLGMKINKTKICGGGAKSPLWRKIICNILNIEVERNIVEEGPGMGAALLAAIGCGEYKDTAEAVAACIAVKDCEEPDKELADIYTEKYGKYIQIYPACKDIFAIINR